jgi:hypothetical protein
MYTKVSEIICRFRDSPKNVEVKTLTVKSVDTQKVERKNAELYKTLNGKKPTGTKGR